MILLNARGDFMDYFIIYGLTYLALFITLGAQLLINIRYKKYSKIKNDRNISGEQTARMILDKNGLTNVKIEKVSGNLTDHYDPKTKTVRLSNNIYSRASIASTAVAAHECGHAIQDKENYKFLRIRASLVPIVNISSYAGYLSILLGLLFGTLNLIWIGISFELVILLFQIITLPVEINASKRALNELDKLHILSSNELKSGKKVLVAAATTYLASVASAIIQILRLILMFGRNND